LKAFISHGFNTAVIDIFQAISKIVLRACPGFGVVGKQRVESTGQDMIEWMNAYDDEIRARSACFMNRAVNDEQLFFAWHSPTRTPSLTCRRNKPT